MNFVQDNQFGLSRGFNLKNYSRLKGEHSSWTDPRLYPAYVGAASAILLILRGISTCKRAQRLQETLSSQESPPEDARGPVAPEAGSWRKLTTRASDTSVVVFKFTRLAATLALTGLSLYTLLHGGTWYDVALTVTLIYAAVLAVLNTSSPVARTSVYSSHLTAVTFTVCALYYYRDIWPLMTFTLRPLDEAEGSILYIKIALLAFISIVEPLFESFIYIPVDAMDPMPTPNPEQTASMISLLSFSFLDPIIWLAYHVPHLSHDQLPPQCDYDYAKNLVKRSYPYLDPFTCAKRQNLFWGLLLVFRRSLTWQSALLIVQLYIFLSTGSVVRADSIITSLVFDHALRIRMKADVSETENASPTDEGSVVDENNSASGSSTDDGNSEAEDSGTMHSKSTTATSVTSTAVTAVGPDVHGKGKATDTSQGATREENANVKGSNLMGKINNLVTSDLENVKSGRDFLFAVLLAPLQIIFNMFFLYVILGWSCFVGLVVMIALTPVPTIIGKALNSVQKEKMKATDARVQNVTEMMNILRMVKLFGWESHVKKTVAEKREAELKLIWKRKLLRFATHAINHIIPLTHMVVTFLTYTLIMKKSLSASVSLGRLTDFLQNTELLDAYSDNSMDESIVDHSSEHKEDVGMGKATFTWAYEPTDGATTPSRRIFKLRVDDELVFQKGKFSLIIGPTASGKTSLLMALLGEMHYIPSGPGSWVNLPREGGIAYAAQESWVQNETIRNNILFGSPYDEQRYKKVIYQCALQRDLDLLEAGDTTEVGEKGLTLSGGQKARVTLARAIYSSAEILLLDDVLAALDVHTARWIVNKCFKSSLMKDRTVILVTHHVALASPVADFIVSLGTDGRIASQGTTSEVLAGVPELAEEMRHEEEVIELDEHEEETGKAAEVKGKLVVAEEIEVGHVSRSSYRLYVNALGGKWSLTFWFQYLTGIGLSEVLDSMETWWLGYWASQYALRPQSEVSVGFYLGMYSILVVSAILSYVYGQVVYTYGSLRASRVLHHTLVSALLGSTFRWLDTTPTSRVITRCTQDIEAVDGAVGEDVRLLFSVGLSMFARFGAVVLFAPLFSLPSIAVAAFGAWLGQLYMKAQLSVKREMSTAKAPVLGILNSAIVGLPSIRAYNAQQAFRMETWRRLDHYVRIARTFYNLNRWIGIRISALTTLYTGALACYLVYGGSNYSASTVGFVMIMASAFSGKILFWVRVYNDFEIQANSLERINQYLSTDQEPKPKDGGTPPAYWPASGDLRVEKLTARYSQDGPLVLKDVSFHIRAGERVGIVGRTGSGKSTLTLSLLRCIPTEGNVYYDGLPTNDMNLDALRSKITIIPQVPELLSGTLRQNLDVFGQYDDATLNDALRAAGLFSLQRLSNENRLMLDSQIASGGGNLSVGQKQIIALARAIVRQSKLLILDEATSAIDYETDAVIQSSLRNELKSDVTVITVAHRLQTVMDCDKIMVLDAGRLVEFDSPKMLLQNDKSLLRTLVDESADKEILFWLNPRLYLAYVGAISATLLITHSLSTSKLARTLRNTLSLYKSPSDDVAASNEPDVRFWSGSTMKEDDASIHAYKLARLVATLTLAGLVLYTVSHEWTQYDVALAATLSYACVLAVLNVSFKVTRASVYSFHLTVVTFAVSALYCYRDIWPLMTFTLQPIDEAEGAILWVKIGLMIFVSTVEPLLEPYTYIPVDMKDPMSVPNPEQTSSLLSFLSFSFLDPIIWLAYRVPHLSYDQLPPQCDYDTAKNLIKHSYPHIDPFAGAKKGNFVWGLLLVFRRSLTWQSIFLVAFAVSQLVEPIGTNRLLRYLETGGEGAIVKPWVWMLWMVVGPLFSGICEQLQIYLSTSSAVRVDSIITSLVFDHALRIRMKAEVSEAKSVSRADDTSAMKEANKVKRSDSSEGFATGSEDFQNADGDETVHSQSTAVASASMPTISAGPQSQTKGKEAKEIQEAKKAGVQVKGTNLIGKINNLITSDMENVKDSPFFLTLLVSTPLRIIFSMAFLYAILGWSCLVGLVVMLALMPAPTMIAKTLNSVQKERMKATDARVQNVTEMTSMLRMFKLFGWESYVKGMVAQKRDEELKLVWKRKLLQLATGAVNHSIPFTHMIVTYATYTLVMKKSLSASVVFSSISAFIMLRRVLYRISGTIPRVIQTSVSLGRIAEFLQSTELLDAYSDNNAEQSITDNSAEHREDIGMGKANFTWTNDPFDDNVIPSHQPRFRLRIEDELIFKKGKFNLIIGPTGSGKTSLLMALLGEMHYIPLAPDAWLNLPKDGGVAYAAQESWVQNETIKDNILFGNLYDEERYKKVIYQCGLKRDLELLEAGDATEVGEKGLTLSGGQKVMINPRIALHVVLSDFSQARLTLARAIYSSANILLLDDVLAALDVHTSRWIVNKCFKGDLVKHRTVLLVTHNVAMAGPLADFVVSLSTDGHIDKQGTASEVLANVLELREQVQDGEESIELDEHEEDVGKGLVANSKGKLVVAEEIEVGHVSKSAYRLFVDALGGRQPVLFWFNYFTGIGVSEVLDNMQTWWLGFWASQYTLHSWTEVSVPFYLGIYVALVISSILSWFCAEVVYTYGTLRASRSIHYKLVSALVGSTFRWLDITPVCRVITRCTQDIQAVDGGVAEELESLLSVAVGILARFGAIVLFAPTFVLPSIAVAAFGGWLGQLYMKAQLSVKREMSTAKAPVLGILGGAITGLPSIRAYNAEHAFKMELARRVDRYARISKSFFNLNRWISIRIDALTTLFTGALAFYLVYGATKYSPSTIGFVMDVAAGFSDSILFWVRVYNDFEIHANSLERINQYFNVEQEPEQEAGGTPPAYWPSSGDLRVENLTARYSPVCTYYISRYRKAYDLISFKDGPVVLEDVSFHIKAGERVGIVGRTGSGKSTLTLSLLRCILTEGTVYYDGLRTDGMNLDALRSNITIIPQVPELLSGTLRQNLDVFGQYDDATLNDALLAAGLFSLQRLSDENRLTLDSQIASGGSNLSVGQRQIIALARAIVRQSKLLILDEATSAIDYETDAVIQSSLRNELKSDVTVITVAHRLQTVIDSDKIMVLDAGRLVEFDSPQNLLQNENSLLRALVDESADKDVLYAMAEGQTQA
ncbi:hypothetical protein NM688_g664 [Phlebia brevispora]|uniref:Uncharacterized protein n=1 Tax=Phlebia brevispora TaxID=194682 RepID=A0ACC1TDY2_9APHY|nr:hypothetical protein NM688_g664 [Phlebia brevispora]